MDQRLGQVRAAAEAQRRRAVAQRDHVIARSEQSLVDLEVRKTRAALRRQVRRRGGNDAAVLFDLDFLAVADEPAVVDTILRAALTATTALTCDLQLLAPDGVLRIRAQHGFGPDFLDHFAEVGTGSPTACGLALATGRPVVVTDTERSRVYTDPAAVGHMLDAGSRALVSHPLCDRDGAVLGVLSFHHSRDVPRGDLALLALGAGRALAGCGHSGVSRSPSVTAARDRVL
ncbi:GAF domain-containing protein [Saccharothrix sp. NPDC042600]|uniref:GAF domain-containing protein n=1 Tax=Saccharothrix TaxID=2071 RepID=UPI0033FC1BC9